MNNLINIILKGIGLAMGVAVVVLSILNKTNMNTSIIMLGLGLSALSILQLNE